MHYYLYIFFAYSFFGWVIEVSEKAIKQNKFINRGFLNGPVCPVYGIGMLLMTVCLKPLWDQFLLLFFGCVIIGTVLEYGTALLLEKVTHIRWWNYEEQPLNFQGRICLASSLLWGFAGAICVKINQFCIGRFEIGKTGTWEEVIWAIVIFIHLLDWIASFVTVFSLQKHFQYLGWIGEKMNNCSKQVGNWIYQNIYTRSIRRKMKKETEEIRLFYQEEKEKRIMKLLQNRMLLAAPDMAPDPRILKELERKQMLKKKRMFASIMLNRVLWTGLCLIAEVILMTLLLTRFAAMSGSITLILTVISMGISLYIISKKENSAYKIGWIMIIMSLPALGGLLYILLGNKNPSRSLQNQIQRVHQKNKGIVTQNKEIIEKLSMEEPRIEGRCRYLYHHTDNPVWENTSTKYYPLGDIMFEDMLEELKKAQHFIFLEYFIVEEGMFWNSLLKILKQKVKEGVEVRVMYDDVGCLMLLPKHYKKMLENEGIKCIAFNPFRPVLSLVMNNRDHRKIMVIDGHTAFTGGINLADEYINVTEKYGHWKDTGMMLKGEAVANLTVMFLEMWNSCRKTDDSFHPFLPHQWHPEPFHGEGYVQPFGDTPLDDEPTAENLYIDIINEASRYVYIFTPYLIISDTMRNALCMAAERGVDVKIVTPGIPDKKIIYRLTRNNYTQLMKSGVEIYEYTPGFLHAKSYVSDDKAAVVGTINMDYRSLYLHFECGVYLHQTNTVLEIKKDVLNTIEKSRKVEDSLLRKGLIERFVDAFLNVISPLV